MRLHRSASNRAPTPASHSFPTTGTTYDYEKGAGSITRLRWDDAKQMLTPHGAAGWSEPDSKIVKIAGH